MKHFFKKLPLYVNIINYIKQSTSFLWVTFIYLFNNPFFLAEIQLIMLHYCWWQIYTCTVHEVLQLFHNNYNKKECYIILHVECR